MKTLCMLLIGLFSIGTAVAQRGDITVPLGAVIVIPANAQLCADRIYANNPGYGTLTLANANCLCPGMSIIPVELLMFTASAENGVVILRWTTATEVNCHGFEVQRLLPGFGEDWQTLGFTQGAGTTSEPQHYTYLDRRNGVQSDVDVLAYRLRLIDFDGSNDFSSIVEVRFNTASQLFTLHPAYPNPALGNVNVSFSLPEASDVTLTLYTVTGEKVLQVLSGASFARGYHVASIPTAGLSRGTYLIELTNGSVRQTQTVMLLD